MFNIMIFFFCLYYKTKEIGIPAIKSKEGIDLYSGKNELKIE